MLKNSSVSVAAILAGLLAIQPVSGAMAEASLSINLGNNVSIHAGPDGVVVDAGTPGLDDPDYEGHSDDVMSDIDVATEEVAEVADEPVLERTERYIIIEPLTCKQGKKLLRRAGYRKIRKLSCGEWRHTYKARKNGRRHRLVVDALNRTFAPL